MPHNVSTAVALTGEWSFLKKTGGSGAKRGINGTVRMGERAKKDTNRHHPRGG